MAYEDTNCPCGGRKLTQVLLCDRCVEHVSASTDWQLFTDKSVSHGSRRAAAIRVLAVARKRRNNPHLALAFSA
jgi:hypothetical protein